MNLTNGNNAMKNEDVLFLNQNMENQDATYRPQYQYICIDDLKVDRYQRALNYSDCKKYKKDFDWYLVGVLLVSLRDGKYYIIDGQHRKVLLQMMGVETTLCQVITGMTYEQEAALFKKYNTMRKSLGRADLLVADVEAGDKRANKIMDVINASPFACERNKQNENAKGKINIHAVKCIEDAYDVLGGNGLEAMLNLIHITWRGDKSAINGRILAGFTCFFKKYSFDEINQKLFVEALSSELPDNILREAWTDAKYSPSSGIKGIPVARVLYKHYNDTLPPRKKLAYLF